MRSVLIAGLLWASPALAQEEATQGKGAVLRALDKVNAQVTDFELSNGGVARFGRIVVHLKECRYPKGNPSGDGFAFLEIGDHDDTMMFSGWMVASSPALNALDHARYDLWVLRCKT